jgi:hypothetical protein
VVVIRVTTLFSAKVQTADGRWLALDALTLKKPVRRREPPIDNGLTRSWCVSYFGSTNDRAGRGPGIRGRDVSSGFCATCLACSE